LTVCNGMVAPTHAGIVYGESNAYITEIVLPDFKDKYKNSLPVSFGLGILHRNIIKYLKKCDRYDMVEKGISLWNKHKNHNIKPLIYNDKLCHIVYPEDLMTAESFLKVY
jgi:hypothetical protein